MATDTNQVVNRNETSAAPPHEPTCLEVIDSCLAVYSAVYREETTEPLAMGFKEALADIRNPFLLHRAFMRAMKCSTFRPNPAEVLSAYRVEFENAPKPKQLELPAMSDEDRAEVEKSFAALREKMGLPARPKVDEKKRRAELARQSAEILAKHPPAKGKGK